MTTSWGWEKGVLPRAAGTLRLTLRAVPGHLAARSAARRAQLARGPRRGGVGATSRTRPNRRAASRHRTRRSRRVLTSRWRGRGGQDIRARFGTLAELPEKRAEGPR